MGDNSLRDLVRKILAGGLALGGAAQTLPALSAPSVPTSDPFPDHAAAPADATNRELVIRAARPKVLLRALDATRVTVISSHRSHRSHSSHRSHYSGSSAPTPPPKPAPVTPKPSSGSAGRGATGADSDTANLGNRVLVRGMRGKDVEQLIILLVKQDLLRTDQVPMESLFNEDVETAVKKFQSSKGVTVDGRVDFRTLLLLKAQ